MAFIEAERELILKMIYGNLYCKIIIKCQFVGIPV